LLAHESKNGTLTEGPVLPDEFDAAKNELRAENKVG